MIHTSQIPFLLYFKFEICIFVKMFVNAVMFASKRQQTNICLLFIDTYHTSQSAILVYIKLINLLLTC